MTFISRRPRVATFVDIKKTLTICIKTVFKDSRIAIIQEYKKVTRIKDYVSKCSLYL